MSDDEQKYAVLLEKIKTGPRPAVLVNACTHGHEKVGLKVNQSIEELDIVKGAVYTNVANERACKEDVAYLESDLNRIFPGRKDGNLEERLAFLLSPAIKAVDVCIDIHSTNTMVVGDESAIIVTDLNKKTLELIEIVKPPRVYVMNATKNNALISAAKVGIGFEYGHDDDSRTHEAVVKDIAKILHHLGIVKEAVGDNNWSGDTKYYDIKGTLSKIGFELTAPLKNYELVKKGTLLGKKNGRDFYAEHDFVPILFGKNRYKDIYCFTADEIKPETLVL